MIAKRKAQPLDSVLRFFLYYFGVTLAGELRPRPRDFCICVPRLAYGWFGLPLGSVCGGACTLYVRSRHVGTQHAVCDRLRINKSTLARQNDWKRWQNIQPTTTRCHAFQRTKARAHISQGQHERILNLEKVKHAKQSPKHTNDYNNDSNYDT